MSATSAPPPDPTADAATLVALPEPTHITPRRKDDHLRIAATERALHSVSTGLERYRLTHRALPGRNLTDVDLTTTLIGQELRAPIVISAMTGGTPSAGLINERLATAAAAHGIGLALGSGRALLRDRTLLGTYTGAGPRPAVLLANIGAAQLLAPRGLQDAEQLVELLGATGLTVHCNALQEAIQPEGETEFSGLVEAVSSLCQRLAPVPVVVKEVGFGMSAEDVELLIGAGVAAVDVAGAGGTNWALVEGERGHAAGALAAAFHGWGVPTAEAVQAAATQARGRAQIIASGGLRDGVEGATCLALGASAVGFARELLLAAQANRADEAIGTLIQQLRIATWLTGAASSADLGPQHLQQVAA